MNANPERRQFLSGLALGAAWLQQGLLFGAEADEKVIPFIGTQPFNPARPAMIWENLTSWITPTEQIFAVAHYPIPTEDLSNLQLSVSGLVSKPRTYTLAELRAKPKTEHNLLLECSGNGAAGGLVGNARWTGTPLAPLLKECGLQPEGIEVVFFGLDVGTEKLGTAEYKQNYARSLSSGDAQKSNVMLAYELNGQPIPKNHGGPLRLVVPGYYGVAWVKWLNRIEVLDRKFQARFMGRDYVTLRGEQKGSETIWRETSVGRMNLKSVAARAARRANGNVHVTGAAWSDGTPIKTVEVRIDDGPWKAAQLTSNKDPFAWTFWSFEWPSPAAGEHSIASRATDARGRIQPAPDDPMIAMKKTRWENNQYAVRKLKIEA